MTPSPEQVSAMLAEDSERIEQLQQLLEQEREILEKRDHQALADLLEHKNRLLAELGQHALQRQNWLRSARLSCDHDGWLRWLEQHPHLQSQKAQWNQLAERFHHCREQNEINGKVLARAQHTNSTLLNLLRGQSQSAPELYNAKGRAGSAGQSQPLTKA